MGVLVVILEFLKGLWEIYDTWRSEERFFVKIIMSMIAIIGIFVGIFMWGKILDL